jgi:hypothetical protein
MGAVHLETLVFTAVAASEAEIVEHRAGVKKLRVKLQTATIVGE